MSRPALKDKISYCKNVYLYQISDSKLLTSPSFQLPYLVLHNSHQQNLMTPSNKYYCLKLLQDLQPGL